jgi:hypothetical protein
MKRLNDRLERKKIMPSCRSDLEREKEQHSLEVIEKRRRVSLIAADLERNNAQRQGKNLAPIDWSLHAEVEQQDCGSEAKEQGMRQDRLEKLVVETEQKRLRTKQEIWDQTNDDYEKQRRKQQSISTNGPSIIMIKESIGFKSEDDNESHASGCSNVPIALPICFVFLAVIFILVVVFENACSKREKSIFDGSCSG